MRGAGSLMAMRGGDSADTRSGDAERQSQSRAARHGLRLCRRARGAPGNADECASSSAYAEAAKMVRNKISSSSAKSFNFARRHDYKLSFSLINDGRESERLGGIYRGVIT